MQQQILHVLHSHEINRLKSECEKRSECTIDARTRRDSRLPEGQGSELRHVLVGTQQQPRIATNGNSSGIHIAG